MVPKIYRDLYALEEDIGVVRVHLSTTREYFTYRKQLTNHTLFII